MTPTQMIAELAQSYSVSIHRQDDVFLHAALYAARHGEADIRQAVQNANDIARELADGLISLMLVCRMRQEFGWTPGCMPDEVPDALPQSGLPSRELAERQGFTGSLSQTTRDRIGEQVKKK